MAEVVLRCMNGEEIARGEDLIALVEANKKSLYGASLAGASLAGASLAGASLAEANLAEANLTGASLQSCIGNGKEVITTQTDIWTVTRTATVMQIGCQRYLISRWWEFTDDEIEAMASRALEWWSRWKPILQTMVEAAPAKDTGSPSP